MIQILYRRHAFMAAERWNELTRKQLREIMKALYSGRSDIQVRLWIWKTIANMKWYQFWMVPPHVVLNHLDLGEFVFQGNELTAQRIFVFRSYYGPRDDFDNIRFNEFVFSESYHGRYCASLKDGSPDINALDSLIAVLFRPAKRHYNVLIDPAGDPREAFNENLIAHRARKIARWPMDIKRLIFTWYGGCKHGLTKAYPDVFRSGSGDGNGGMLSIMRNMAKDGTYGPFEQVETLYLKTVMMELQTKIREADELKKSMKL